MSNTPSCSKLPTLSCSFPACLVSLVEQICASGPPLSAHQHSETPEINPGHASPGIRRWCVSWKTGITNCTAKYIAPLTATPADHYLPIDSGLAHLAATCLPKDAPKKNFFSFAALVASEAYSDLNSFFL